MPYMVIFQDPEGNPGYNQFEGLEGAVNFVEGLRNDQGVENARMFELEEIKFELRPIYKVEMAALGAGTPPAAEPVVDLDQVAAPEPVVLPDPPAAPEPPVAEVPVAEVPVAEVPSPPLAEYEPPVAPPAPEAPAESFPPPPAAPAPAGGPSFAPPPPMPPNEDPGTAPAPPAPPAEEQQPARRGLFGR